MLEALAPVVVPSRGAGVTGWPILPELTITYAVVAGRLELAAELVVGASIDGRALGAGSARGLVVCRR